jgi:2-polyprenyl-3-methyl-5-hydroxy-6-metoxy-1,4-benzoquinol methylase
MSTSAVTPPMSVQRDFWDAWNRKYRVGGVDPFMDRQRDKAVEWALRLGHEKARILEVGCGTGWLGSALSQFGDVTGIDLSEGAVEEGRALHPEVAFHCGDFLSLPLVGQFDLILSADVIAHVADQQAFTARVVELLRPGGTFLLMTQNPKVWRRKSSLAPRAEGQIRDWPSLTRIRALLRDRFRLVHVNSLVPGGDRGLLWWVENRWVRGGIGRLIGRDRWCGFLERALLGRELVVVALRMP